MEAVVEIELVCLDPNPEELPVERQHWALEAWAEETEETEETEEYWWSVPLWGLLQPKERR